MLEVLSTIGLTASASLVIGCRRLRDGPDAARALSVRGRSRRLVRARARDRRRGRARSRLRVRRSRSGTNGRVAGRCADWRLLRLRAKSNRRIGGAIAGAGRGERDPNSPRVDVCASLRRGDLPAPFAPSAGWGDIFVGAAALPLAWSIIRFGRRVAPLVFAWSVIGIADLVNAIALGALSAPGPLQAFAGPPTSAIMTTLPWLIVPGFLVPCLMFIHVVIFARLAGAEASVAGRPWLGGGVTKLT